MSRFIERRCLIGLTMFFFVWSIACAGDKQVQFLSDRQEEEKVMSDLAVVITKAAHSTGKSPSLRKYKITEPKKGRIKVVLDVQYKGALTGNVYFGEIVILIDRQDKELLKLEFTDLNNSIQPNEYELRKARSHLQSLLEELLK